MYLQGALAGIYSKKRNINLYRDNNLEPGTPCIAMFLMLIVQ